MPDPQWDLLQQSLRAHNANGSEADVATSVIVEAGVLVRTPLAFHGSTTSGWSMLRSRVSNFGVHSSRLLISS